MFPFILLSSFVIRSKLADEIIYKYKKTSKNVLGICKIYLSSILLGSVSGFITGPKCICSIYSDKEEKDAQAFSDSVILSSNCGVGFVISCVGILIWNSVEFGIFLYTSEIITSLLLGKLLLKGHCNTEYIYTPYKPGLIDSFTYSVSSAFSSVFNACSFVIFFSLLSDIFALYINSTISSLLSIIFEFSKGTFNAVSFNNVFISAFLTGFSIGFGGLSVMFQTFSICSGYPLNKKKYLIFKLLHGVILGMLASLYMLL
ncbi:MAG: hypothetical protein IJX51_02625 [Clostridia bacterium]|nr:hypothetical protein [Clostridia bacterium]